MHVETAPWVLSHHQFTNVRRKLCWETRSCWASSTECSRLHVPPCVLPSSVIIHHVKSGTLWTNFSCSPYKSVCLTLSQIPWRTPETQASHQGRRTLYKGQLWATDTNLGATFLGSRHCLKWGTHTHMCSFCWGCPWFYGWFTFFFFFSFPLTFPHSRFIHPPTKQAWCEHWVNSF